MKIDLAAMENEGVLDVDFAGKKQLGALEIDSSPHLIETSLNLYVVPASGRFRMPCRGFHF